MAQEIYYPASGTAPVITWTGTLLDQSTFTIDVDPYMETEITVNWTYEYVFNGVASAQYYTADTSRTFRFMVYDCDIPSIDGDSFAITNDRHSDFIREEVTGENDKWWIIIGATAAWDYSFTLSGGIDPSYTVPHALCGSPTGYIMTSDDSSYVRSASPTQIEVDPDKS